MDGNYCMLDSMIKEAQDSDNMNAGKIMCKPGGCGLKMMGFMADFHLAQECAKSKTDCDAASAVVAQKTLFLSAGCFKKDNKYCMDYISEGPPKWDEVVKSCGFPEDPSSTIAETLGTTCSDTCKATWQSLVDNWGCCAPTMAITIQKTFDNAITKQSTSCNIANGPGYCQGGTPRSFSIEVLLFLKHARVRGYSRSEGLILNGTAFRFRCRIWLTLGTKPLRTKSASRASSVTLCLWPTEFRKNWLLSLVQRWQTVSVDIQYLNSMIIEQACSTCCIKE